MYSSPFASDFWNSTRGVTLRALLSLINSDAAPYGGSNVGNLGGVEAEASPWQGQPYSAELTLPPLGVLWLVPEGHAT